jgi:hypothetical protein
MTITAPSGESGAVLLPYLLVLVDEEHLRRVFGQQYVEFCCKTPRYLGCGV